MRFIQYGLRRTGTNWFEQLFKKNFSIEFLNKNNTESSIHKHSMYQTLPQFEKIENFKKYITSNFDCKNVHFIVHIKHPYAWYLSMKKWRAKNGSKCEPLDVLVERYNRFYTRWISYYKQSSEEITFIKYNELLKSYARTLHEIGQTQNLKHINKPPPTYPSRYFNVTSNVPQSSRFTENRKQWYLNKQYVHHVTKEEKELINRKVDPTIIKHFQYVLQ